MIPMRMAGDVRLRNRLRYASTSVPHFMSAMTPISAPVELATTSMSDESRLGRNACPYSTTEEIRRPAVPARSMTTGKLIVPSRASWCSKAPRGTNISRLSAKCTGSCS